VEFRLLGPVEVVKDGRSIGLGGGKQRLVLAHLVLRAGYVVPSEILIDALWGEEPPPTARNTLQTYVYRLRAAIGDDRIDGRAGGYRLEATPDELDIARFERLVRRAEGELDADPQAAAEAFDDALSLWHGYALSDLADEPSLRGEIARLEELRLGATVDRNWVKLQLGQGTTAVAELESLTERYPLREHLWASLMLALYRTGRQADALAAFQRARGVLADELGIDPSSELVHLHEQILSHDPGLEPAEPPRLSARSTPLGDDRVPPLKIVTPSNLPVPATHFLGRRVEVESVKSLLANNELRVVTLTGPGGTGKTRLALQAAKESSEAFVDGSWWVPLAPVTDSSLLLSNMATAMGIEERSESALAIDVTSKLQFGRSLVLLDNAEHLLPSLTDELAPIIEAASGATFLVTSRAPLHLESEYEFPVPPMNTQDAEAFFISRAEAGGVRVGPSPELTALCERLDRLPLAIQLAAARAKLFSVEQLAQRMSSWLDISSQRGSDPRQQTLRATIEWSHSLLTSHEKLALSRLSVFVGSASMTAIEQVTGADPEALFALLDQSLIRRQLQPDEPYFWMLETIREFARERLEEAGELAAMKDRHASFYRDLAEQAGLELDRGRGEWLNRLDAAIQNLRVALGWFLERGDEESAQAIAGSVGTYMYERGLLSEWRTWMDRSLEPGGFGPAHALALSRLSDVARLQGDYNLARTTGERAVSEAEDIGDIALIHSALMSLDYALADQGALDQAWDGEQKGLELARQLHDRPRRLLISLINIGYLALVRTMYEDARHYSEEAVALAGELGEVPDEAAARCTIAMALFWLGRVDEASRQATDAAWMAIEAADQVVGMACLEVLAAIEAERGNDAVSARLLGASDASRKEIGYELEQAERTIHDHTIAKLRSRLSDRSFSKAWKEGLGLTLEQALARI
jgi:predicted ATPase/DNA-binding SARP family transcriptional activator